MPQCQNSSKFVQWSKIDTIAHKYTITNFRRLVQALQWKVAGLS
jgi:hypothetical protein